jgi:integrase
MIAVLIGCGPRRAEAATLKLEDIQLREGRWVIADLSEKVGHIRTVPMPDWVKRAIDEWTVPAGLTSGPLCRAINKAGRTLGKWIHGNLVDRCHLHLWRRLARRGAASSLLELCEIPEMADTFPLFLCRSSLFPACLLA